MTGYPDRLPYLGLNNFPNSGPIKVYNIPSESLFNYLSIDAKIDPVFPLITESQQFEGESPDSKAPQLPRANAGLSATDSC